MDIFQLEVGYSGMEPGELQSVVSETGELELEELDGEVEKVFREKKAVLENAEKKDTEIMDIGRRMVQTKKHRTSRKILGCPKCNEIFKSRPFLLSHIDHHGKHSIFNCRMGNCDFSLDDKRSFSRHMKRAHASKVHPYNQEIATQQNNISHHPSIINQSSPELKVMEPPTDDRCNQRDSRYITRDNVNTMLHVKKLIQKKPELAEKSFTGVFSAARKNNSHKRTASQENRTIKRTEKNAKMFNGNSQKMINIPYKTEEKQKLDIIEKTTAVLEECLQKVGYIPYRYNKKTRTQKQVEDGLL